MKLALDYEELHILVDLLAEEILKTKHRIELLEKFGHDDVYEYQEHQITLMNGMLKKLNIIYKESFDGREE